MQLMLIVDLKDEADQKSAANALLAMARLASHAVEHRGIPRMDKTVDLQGAVEVVALPGLLHAGLVRTQ